MSKLAPGYVAKKLSGAYLEISDALDELVCTQPKEPTVPTVPEGAGLAALKRRSDYEASVRVYISSTMKWETTVESSLKKISQRTSRASQALSAAYVGLILDSPRKQVRGRKPAFAHPLAGLRYLLAVIGSLYQFENEKGKGRPFTQPRREDWRRLEEAVKSMSRVLRSGVPLPDLASRVGIRGISAVSLASLHGRVRSQQGRVKKAHNDKYAVQRLACRRFTEAIFHEFDGSVPLSWVERFGELLGYTSEKLGRTYVKQWCKEMTTNDAEPTLPHSAEKRRNTAG